MLLEDDLFSISNSLHHALNSAIQHGSKNIVRLLLEHPNANPGFNNNELIKTALKYKKNDMLSLLISDYDLNPFEYKSTSEILSETSSPECLEILLNDSRYDKSFNLSSLLVSATMSRHDDILLFLLNECKLESSDRFELALFAASEKNNIKIMELLLADKRTIISNNFRLMYLKQIEKNFR